MEKNGNKESAAPKPVALVTGGAIRVGRSICEALAPTHVLAIHHHRSQAQASELAESLPDAQIFNGDLTNPNAPARLVEDVVSRYGRLDALVNNAAVFAGDETDMVTLARMKVLNVDAPKRLMRAATPYLEATGGAIVNISDIAGIVPFKGRRAYSTSKAALIEIGITGALEMAERGIRVNTICPGIVLPGPEETKNEEILRAEIPLGRFGKPTDIAKLVAFLVDSTFITGQTIAVDGGRLLCYAEIKNKSSRH